MRIAVAGLTAGDQIHLLVFRKLRPAVVCPRLEIAQVISVFLGERGQEFRDGALISLALRVIVFQRREVRISGHIDDRPARLQRLHLSAH